MDLKELVVIGVVLLFYILLIIFSFLALYSYLTALQVASKNAANCSNDNLLEIETVRYSMLKEYYPHQMPSYRLKVEFFRDMVFVISYVSFFCLLASCYFDIAPAPLETKLPVMVFVYMCIIADLFMSCIMLPQMSVAGISNQKTQVPIGLFLAIGILIALIAFIVKPGFRNSLIYWISGNKGVVVLLTAVLSLTFIISMQLGAFFNQTTIDGYTAAYDALLAPVMPGAAGSIVDWSKLYCIPKTTTNQTNDLNCTPIMDKILVRYASYNGTTIEAAKTAIDADRTLCPLYIMYDSKSPDLEELLAPGAILQEYTSLAQFSEEQQDDVIYNYLKAHSSNGDGIANFTGEIVGEPDVLTMPVPTNVVNEFMDTITKYLESVNVSNAPTSMQPFFTHSAKLKDYVNSLLMVRNIQIPIEVAQPLAKYRLNLYFTEKNYTELEKYFAFNVYLPIQKINSLPPITDNVYTLFNSMGKQASIMLWACTILTILPIYFIIVRTNKQNIMALIIAAFLLIVITIIIYIVSGGQTK